MTDAWRIEQYTPTKKEEWNHLVSTSRAPHFLFYRDYMEYHADRVQDASVLLYEGRRLAAALPANRDGDVIRSHGGLTFGGFITDTRVTAHRMLAAVDTAMQFFRDEGFSRIVYAPVPHIYHAVPAEEDLYALFRRGARLVRRDLSSTIDLTRRVRTSKGRRSSRKRAMRDGLTVERSSDYHAFIDLLASVLEERYDVAPTHTGDELALLAAHFPDAISLYIARADEEFLAGVVIYETEMVVHTQYIAASEAGRRCGAVDAIVTSLLENIYAEKRYFDFGISTERGGMYLNEGLIRNKESYGARGVAYDRYELDLHPSHLA